MSRFDPLRRRPAVRWGGLVLAIIAIGLLVLVSGIVPITASSGHSDLTYWLLDYGKQRSVQTWSMRVKVPEDFGTPAQVIRGAGHYATGCAPCHGAPGLPPSETTLHMVPEPPLLTTHVQRWDEKELFYIVRHGIKFTGMPYWPAPEREDEIWSVVAFLRELPQLSPAEYRQLAMGEDEAFQRPLDGHDLALSATLADCSRCHGRDGRGRGIGAFPRLDLQGEAYLRAALDSYRLGKRHSGIMESVARDLGAEDVAALAAFYAAGAKPAQHAGVPGDRAVARGREIAHQGLPERRIPACTHCHGPGRTAENALFPRLTGQHPDYIRNQLELFKSRHRGGTPYAKLMTQVAQGLEAEEISQLAAYYGSLDAGEGAR